MARRNKWRILIPTMLMLLAVAAVARIYSKEGNGFFDFHCFWYGGNHIWQGTDPYRAFLGKEEVVLPVCYLDGVTVKEGPIDPFNVQCAPGNTAPVVFLLSPLARYSWQTASSIWFALNTLFSLAIGCVLLKMAGRDVLSHEGALLIALIILQVSTREALEMGQTSPLIVFCMFMSMLLTYRNRTGPKALVSGLLLGLAISKQIMDRHKGEIRFGSAEDHGTIVQLAFPINS